jgi:hypothetical protein
MRERNSKPKVKFAHPDTFTDRQKAIIEAKASGLNYKQTATKLGVSVDTIRTFIAGNNAGDSTRTDRGIVGIIESKTGSRPRKGQWFNSLLRDGHIGLEEEPRSI